MQLQGFLLKSDFDGHHVIIFVEYILFHNVGLSWLVQSENQSEYKYDWICPYWFGNGPWYNVAIRQRLCGVIFKYFYVIER